MTQPGNDRLGFISAAWLQSVHTLLLPVLPLKMAEPPERRSLGPTPEAPALTLYHPAGAVTFFLLKAAKPVSS